MGSKYITVQELKIVLDDKLSPLKSEVAELRRQLLDTNKFLDLENERYEEINKTLADESKVQQGIVAENRVLKATVQSLERKIDDMEQYSRRECIEIHDIPLPKEKDRRVKENTNSIVIKIGEMIGVDLDEDDISVSHRLPVSQRYAGKRSAPAIIAKFVRRDMKEQFYRSRKQLKNLTTKDLGYDTSQNIYINESLTEKNKALFKESVKAKKDLGFDYIWTSNGKIYVRNDEYSPFIHIRSQDDIEKKLYGK